MEATDTQQRLAASPLGILLSKLGDDIGDIRGLFSPTQLSAVADALEDPNNPIYATLSCLQNGKIHDTMVCGSSSLPDPP
jgi:hypothetical protein